MKQQTIEEEKSNQMREKAVSEYIRQKHNSDECIGFCDGYEQHQKDIQPLVNSHKELLEALERIVDRVGENKFNNSMPSTYDRCMAAIEKAQSLINK